MYRYRRKPWPERHPILLAVGVLLGACIVAALWWLFLAAAVLAGVAVGVLCMCQYVEQHNRLRAAQGDCGHPLWIPGDFPP